MNEREAYISNIKDKLSKAANAKKFVESEEGSFVITYIQELVSAKTNKIIANRLTHEEYIELRAQIDVLRRLKQVLEVQADDTVINKLSEDLTLAESGE